MLKLALQLGLFNNYHRTTILSRFGSYNLHEVWCFSVNLSHFSCTTCLTIPFELGIIILGFFWGAYRIKDGTVPVFGSLFEVFFGGGLFPCRKFCLLLACKVQRKRKIRSFCNDFKLCDKNQIQILITHTQLCIREARKTIEIYKSLYLNNKYTTRPLTYGAESQTADSSEK